MKRRTVGIIGAMDSEVIKLAALLKDRRQTDAGGLSFLSGTIAGQAAVIAKSGVGKVNAARCAQVLADRFEPDFIVNTGIAGGLDPQLAVGDVVIATGLVQHDFDVSAFGCAKGYLCTGENPDRPTVFYPDEALVLALEKAAQKLLPARRVRRGIIATGDLFVSDPLKRKALRESFGALAAEMEGAAIAQTAFANRVPFVALRAVSDLADGTAAASFDEFEKDAADLSAAIIEELLSILKKTGGDIRGELQ